MENKNIEKEIQEILNNSKDGTFMMGQLFAMAQAVLDNKIDVNYVCEKLGVPEETIWLIADSIRDKNVPIVDRIVVPRGGRPTQLTEEIINDLSKNYKSKTIPELAKNYSVSIRTMNRWLKELGLTKNNRKDE